MSLLLNRVTRLARPRPAQDSRVTITSMVRQAPFTYVATVAYKHGLTRWTERIQFVARYDGMARIITVSDADFPHDRGLVIFADDPTIGTEDIARAFLLRGTW